MASAVASESVKSEQNVRSGEQGSNGTQPIDQARRPSAGELNTALVHLYRAEVGRATTWRQRLDVTTNWAVITTGASMTFAFGDVTAQRHVVILLSTIMVTFFLLLEARRYRNYDLWQSRVALLEREFYAPLLDPDDAPVAVLWSKELASEMRQPHYHISSLEAIGWRLRRNYFWLYLSHLLIWFVKVAIHPAPITSISQFFARATVGPVPGWIMVVFGIAFNIALLIVALLGTRRVCAGSEIIRC